MTLRPAVDADLPCSFRHQADPEARWMAAFVPSDPDDLALFLDRWRQLLADPTVRVWTIVGPPTSSPTALARQTPAGPPA